MLILPHYTSHVTVLLSDLFHACVPIGLVVIEIPLPS